MRPLALLAALAASPTPAFACGGFFCNAQVAPVDQAAERIIFGVDEGTGLVTTHVQIAYEGAAEDFAWVVPVGAVPELFVSNDALFTVLANGTVPTYQLTNDVSGACEPPSLFRQDSLMSFEGGMDDGGVTVISEATVGPYDTVILAANDTAQLVEWLQEAGYDIADDIESVLQPYVAGDQYFVALKLASGKDTGDLTPLGMRYPGTAASVPIQLTAIAAVPDMPLEVFVLGKSRAVPDNYLHVELNDAAIDWYAGGTNNRDVISRAADEAGGQAFATDFSGSTDTFSGIVWSEGMASVGELEISTNAMGWVGIVQGRGLPTSSQLIAVFEEFVPMPASVASQGVTPQQFYACMGCYIDGYDGAFDASAATAALDERVLQPLREAQAMIDAHPHLTRMTSSLDAAEMTADPMFVFNADMEQDVSNVHTAVNEIHCGTYEGFGGGERVLVLADGRRIPLPSTRWLARNELTELDVIGNLASPAALVVADLSAEGQGEILFDWRDEAADEARAYSRSGCGCSTQGAPAMPLVALLAGLLVRRRR